MPRIDQSIPPEDALLARCALIEDRAKWSRKSNGNLVRGFDGYVLTVFWAKRGGYSWSRFFQGGEPQYSTGKYETEEEAIESLAVDMVRD